MTCVTLDEVKTILPAGTTLTDPQIRAALTAAGCTLEQVADCTANLSQTCLATVETYLAAHYAAATENTLSIKSEKDACCGGSATYGFEFGEGIMGTPFGQMANTLSGGCLAELDKPKAGLYSIGCH